MMRVQAILAVRCPCLLPPEGESHLEPETSASRDLFDVLLRFVYTGDLIVCTCLTALLSYVPLSVCLTDCFCLCVCVCGFTVSVSVSVYLYLH